MASARFGVISAGRDAALALAGTEVWTFLGENLDWLQQFKDVVVAEPNTVIAGVSTEHLSRLLSADGVDQLKAAADILVQFSSDACVTAYDQAAQGSTAQACAFALDRLATALTRCTHGTGTLDGTADCTRLVQVRTPAAYCALCGLTMCCEENGTSLVPSGPPPYDEASSESGESGECLGRMLIRSMVPSELRPGWVLWRKQTGQTPQAPCGHMLHDHC